MIYPLIHKQLKITRPGKTIMLDEASDNNEIPPPDNYVHTEKEQEKYIAFCFKQWGWPTNEEFQTWVKDMKDKASGYCSKSRCDEILFEIKSQALARRENRKFIISEMKASSQGSVQIIEVH